MKLSQLIKEVTSLTTLNLVDMEIETINDLKVAKRNVLYFVKNKKFLTRLISLGIKNISPSVVVFDKQLFEISDDEILELESNGCSIVVTESIPLSICKVSKIFYDLVVNKEQLISDGRKKGNAVISPKAFVSEQAFIGENVQIAEGAFIHPNATILKGSKIGEGCEIFPNTTIYSRVNIGRNCRIHSGSVIGSDGFGYNFIDGVHHKIWHFGGVIIEDNVEIGSNSSVDQGTFSPTIIKQGCKIDNQVQVAHNVHLGQGVILCAQSGIAGSTEVGDFTVLAGKAGLTNDIKVGKGVQVAGCAAVMGNLDDGEIVGGIPARNLKEWLKVTAMMRKIALKK